MARKHLILVHGRSIKPAREALITLSHQALASGLRRAGRQDRAPALSDGRIKVSFAYYGDINNRILSKADAGTRKKLTAKDPAFGNAACFPSAPLEDAFALTEHAYPRFDAATYKKVLQQSDDWKLLDEAADAVSLFGALLTGGLLNTWLINQATADLGAYLTSHSIGSEIRARLSETLEAALSDGDDICLLTHSMGCMVAYDILWKYAHMNEYAALRNRGNRVALWLTIGNPLGETGVRRNLLDGRYSEDDKYPTGQIDTWANFYAQDDYVAHIERIAPIYRTMPKPGAPSSITDTKIYNCWVYQDVKNGRQTSNPHDLYGYLMNQKVAGRLADWIAAP
ncbi:hypothetical protein AAIH46_00495 [Rhizobium sp. 0TCS1.26]|uniref:hypothetical protein n=1 Tax=Rhizobium sp. 0TCS1.26 TaxID=3142623 RepID=UPI003D2BC2F5